MKNKLLTDKEFEEQLIASMHAAGLDASSVVKGSFLEVDTKEHNAAIKKATYKFVRAINHICNGDAFRITITNMKGLTQDREAVASGSKLYDMKKARVRLEMDYF